MKRIDTFILNNAVNLIDDQLDNYTGGRLRSFIYTEVSRPADDAVRRTRVGEALGIAINTRQNELTA